MPRVAEVGGISFYVYFKDHAPPHVHAFEGDDEVLIVIATGAIYDGALKGSAQRMAVSYVLANRAYFQAKWDQYNP